MSSPEISPAALERFHSALDLVEIVAHQLRRSMGKSLDLQELMALGREGLLRAAMRFDESREVPFRAYAGYRVRGAMIDGMRQMSYLPRRIHQRAKVLEAANRFSEGLAQDELTGARMGSPADAERILDEHLAGMATAMAVGLVAQPVLGEDGEKDTVARVETPEEAVSSSQMRALLDEHIGALPKEEQELVRRHYFEGERFDHVAEELGLSKSWASRLHSRAIARLAKRLRGAT